MNNLPNDQRTNDLHDGRNGQNQRTPGILKQNLHVGGIQYHEHDQHENRESNQDAGRQSSLRRAHSDFAIDAEAVAYDARQAIENFRKVSAGFLLNKQSGDEETDVDRRDPLGHVEKSVAQWQTEILLFERGAEF